MPRITLPILAACLAFGGGLPAVANDSVAELAAGGIVLGRSDEISMERETLYLSMERVTVDYLYRNRSQRDVTTIVAFPMPDITLNIEGETGVPQEGDNFLGFTVEVDGQQITPALQQRAIVAGIDVTDRLRAVGFSILPADLYAQLDVSGADASVLADLETFGAIRSYEPEGSPAKWWPSWTVQSTYWWTMHFPAGEAVAVSHSYRPATGGSVGTYMITSGVNGTADPSYVERYCVDDGFSRAVARKIAESGDEYLHSETWLSYILTTGGNWAGSIGSFKLIVDKGSTANLVSFCGEGVSKTGPTTFEMEKTDFWPERDLHVLFVVAPQG
jgi:hypothetical protein